MLNLKLSGASSKTLFQNNKNLPTHGTTPLSYKQFEDQISILYFDFCSEWNICGSHNQG